MVKLTNEVDFVKIFIFRSYFLYQFIDGIVFLIVRDIKLSAFI